VTSYTVGGLIHVLLIVAIIIIVVRLVQGRRIWATRPCKRKLPSWASRPRSNGVVAPNWQEW